MVAVGAGFPGSVTPADLPHAFFGAVGREDLNYQEMRRLQRDLAGRPEPHRLAVFDGGHEWMPPAVAEQALEWMHLQAMRDGRLEADRDWIQATFARHWQARAEARCDGADCGSPHAQVGGVSYRWFNQSCLGSEKARGMAAARIAVPVLLLQGEKDTVVKPGAQQAFCRRVNEGGSGTCVGRTVPQALHSIFIEADTYRGPALQRVLGFFDCVRAGGTPRCGQ